MVERCPVREDTRIRLCWAVSSRVSRVTSRIIGGWGVAGWGEYVAVRKGLNSFRRVSVSSNSRWNYRQCVYEECVCGTHLFVRLMPRWKVGVTVILDWIITCAALWKKF